MSSVRSGAGERPSTRRWPGTGQRPGTRRWPGARRRPGARPRSVARRRRDVARRRRGVLALPVLAAALLALSACGSSVADRTSPRTVTTTQAAAVSPFCEAVQNRGQSARPISEPGRRVDDIGAVADRVRTANQQVTALAPQELRADFERVNGLIERQLRLLEANGGDTFALAGDPDIAREARDPAYTEASKRINDYVRATC